MKSSTVTILIILAAFTGLAQISNAEENSIDFSVGGEERIRVELRDNLDFNKNLDDEGYLSFQRLLINGKLTYKQNLTLFMEGNDIKEGSNGINKTGQQDDIDLYQGYVEYTKDAAAIKIGRQKLSYGDKRILAAPTWANKLKSFDAIKASLSFENYKIDAFGGNIALYDDNNFNDAKAHEWMYGGWVGYKNKGFIVPQIELLYLTVYNEDDLIKGENNQYGKLSQHTIDAILRGKLFSSGINYSLEFAYQFGKYGTNDIEDAYAIHADIKRKFDCLLEPEIILEYNNASGDKDTSDVKTNTFISYYQTTHAPYGLMDFFRWQNMREIALSVNLTPSPDICVTPSINCFWLDEKRDSWYKSSGSKIRTSNTSEVDDFVGAEFSCIVTYKFNKNLKFETGYAHFFTGPYVKGTGSNDDADWAYIQTQISF